VFPSSGDVSGLLLGVAGFRRLGEEIFAEPGFVGWFDDLS